MKEIATLRNNDWKKLEPFFNIPKQVRMIDNKKIELKDKTIIPNDLEFQILEEFDNKDVEEFSENLFRRSANGYFKNKMIASSK